MKRCKYQQGKGTRVYAIDKKSYEENATPKYAYEEITASGKRAYAVCPYCDNPIVLYGIVSELADRNPYGAHVRKSVKKFSYNERTFSYCPAYTGRQTPRKADRYEHMQPINREIYNCLRGNLSSAVYILSQDLGLLLSEKEVEGMLRGYLASEAYMYCGATLYNIPWMLLYFSGEYIPLWHARVRKGSWLHEFLRERKDLSLSPVISSKGEETTYLCVEKTGKWLDLRLDFVEHEQKYSSKEDVVRGTIAVRLSTRDRNDRQVGPDGKVFQKDKTKIIKKLDINEYRHPNLTASENKVVRAKLQELAYQFMPEI